MSIGNTNKLRVAVVGYGNIGRYAVETVLATPDMELAGVIRRDSAQLGLPHAIPSIDETTDIAVLGKVDVALICKNTRQVETYAQHYLAQGICTVDSFDVHSDIVALRSALSETAQRTKAAAIISSGWDPGTDSIMRTMLEACAPSGVTYTDFGPGMSMGHTVAVKAIAGVADAISLTIPLGTEVHRRIVYVQLEPNADFEAVRQAIVTDPYFVKDETHVKAVPDVSAYLDMGHGVRMTRKGRSGSTDNQMFTFDMRINNPALTAQIMVSCARAVVKQPPGAYTMIEIPLIDLLPGERETLIGRLV